MGMKKLPTCPECGKNDRVGSAIVFDGPGFICGRCERWWTAGYTRIKQQEQKTMMKIFVENIFKTKGERRHRCPRR
jgi:transposase-like protein